MTDKNREPCGECSEPVKLQAMLYPHCVAKDQRW